MFYSKDKMIKYINNKLYFINVIIVIITFNLYLYFLNPLSKDIKKLRNSNNINKTIKNKNKLYSINNLDKYIAFKDTAETTSYLQNIINKYGFQMEHLNYQEKNKGLNIIDIGLKIDYINLIEFLGEFVNTREFIDIKEFSLKRLQDSLDVLLDMKIEAMVNE